MKTDDDTSMSLDEIYADLVGVSEIAQELKVTLHAVKRWVERRESNGSPRPVRTLGLGNVYSLHEWKGWYALWRITRGSQYPDRMNKQSNGEPT